MAAMPARSQGLPIVDNVLISNIETTDDSMTGHMVEEAPRGQLGTTVTNSVAAESAPHADRVPVREICFETSCQNYEEKEWKKALPRFIKSCPSRCPRIFAWVTGIVLPLWFLIGLSALGGRFVAEFEGPNEYDTNDSILAKRIIIENGVSSLNRTAEQIVKLPESCLFDFFRKTVSSETNLSLYDFAFSVGIMSSSVSSEATFEEIYEDEFDWRSVLFDLKDHMVECGGYLGAVLETYALEDFTEDPTLDLYFDELTFNWVRCWDVGNYGQYFRFQPTDEHIAAAANQSNFYEEAWLKDQQRLEELYLSELPGPPSEKDMLLAKNRSINEATGRNQCTHNIVGTTWFFFTVMTTVGYGNQAPVTTGGRALTASFGFFSILAFGIVSAVAAKMLIIIFEDLMRRWKTEFLNRPGPGAIFWFFVALAWTFFVGRQSFKWWKDRLSLEQQVYATEWESAWFAFISTTTVGLGDFFLQPEFIFLPDVLAFSCLFLTAFMFYATLIGHLTALISSISPDLVENLKRQVADTNLTNMDRTIRGGITRRQEDDNTSRGEINRVDLMTLLLKDRQGINKNTSGRSLCAICEEEELLKMLLDQCSMEKQKNEEESFP